MNTFAALENSSSRYASSNVLSPVPPGIPRAVSHEDITRYLKYLLFIHFFKNIFACFELTIFGFCLSQNKFLFSDVSITIAVVILSFKKFREHSSIELYLIKKN